MDTLIQRAKVFATQAHRRIDQRRKYTAQPYEVHLKAVAELVGSVTDDAEMIAAAWLHDTLEDTPATYEDIEKEFGPGVAQLVADLTDISRPSDGNRAIRKAIDRAHLARAGTRAKTVKLADLVDNCRDICKHDPGFAKLFVTEASALLEVLEQGDSRLYRKAHELVSDCGSELGLPALPLPALELEEIGYAAQPYPFSAGHQRALRMFVHSFAAKDVAEPLRSVDSDRPREDIVALVRDRHLEVVGMRLDGTVIGYLGHEDLEAEDTGASFRPFRPDQLIDGEASLSDVIHVLTRHDYCFVTMLDEVTGVVFRRDIESPIVRMWLFGIITVIEMGIAARIRQVWPNGEWTRLLSPGRLMKAEELLAMRNQRGQSCGLIDCLQLSDKAQILMEDPVQRQEFGFDTKGAAKRVVKELESLRNHLAHAQEIVTHDWPQIVRMTQRIEELVRRTD
jgi:hypothetical protein